MIQLKVSNMKIKKKQKMIENLHAKLGTGPFPPPPADGTEDIIPITNIEELVQEATEMKNCVATYASSIISGGIYIYKVLQPERATLAINYDEDRLSLNELKAVSNGDATQETLNAIQWWLNQEVSRFNELPIPFFQKS
jgi:hypothetical protein